MGIGLGVISGTTLKMLSIKESQKNYLNQRISFDKYNILQRESSLGSFKPKTEIKELSSRWQYLAAKKRDLKASAFLLILDDGSFAEMASEEILPAASSIKTAILLVALEMIDSGKLRWDEDLSLTREAVGGGAGWMAFKKVGTKFPTHEVATEMIRVSDNTATNILIQRIGGKRIINARFKSLGLNSTKINNFLPDLAGTNTTSAKDLAKTIALAETGKLLSPRKRDLFREVLSTSLSNRLIPVGLLKGLGRASNTKNPDYRLLIEGYRVYNKTGDIGIAYSDAGLIELPDGRRAVAAFMVKGPFNDPRSTSLIRKMAEAMVQVFQSERVNKQRAMI